MIANTLLLRQVNPRWIRNGRITSQVFRPTPKDQKMLSVYDGDKVSPEGSFRHYTEKLSLSSAGVMAITVAECRQEELPVIPDPAPFPEHVIVDFSSCSNSEIRTKAKLLTKAAENRGWQYRDAQI